MADPPPANHAPVVWVKTEDMESLTVEVLQAYSASSAKTELWWVPASAVMHTMLIEGKEQQGFYFYQ